MNKIVRNAIDSHNAQSTLFENRYLLFQEDPYQTTFTYGRKKTNELIEPMLAEYPPPKDVLDVGCGTGYLLKTLAEIGYQCTGADAAEDMLAIARRENPNIRFESTDATHLPFENDSFDMVLAIELLRYIKQTELSVKEMFRVLRPGGVCIATVAPLLSTHGYVLVNRLMKILPIPGFSHVPQYFETVSSMTRKCRDAGFADVDVQGCFFGPFIWLSRLISKRMMGSLLKAYEPWDSLLMRQRWLHNLSNHLVVIAQKTPTAAAQEESGT